MRLFWYLAITCAVVSWMDNALAQRRPIADDTLGEERSIVTPEDDIRGLPGDRIEGGARRGDNLFHSFQEFNIDPNRAVYFDDPGVINILSRVTGGNVSNIQGTLGVLGDANLFLINPSGIIFGEGARLDVSGSFVATSADAIQFGNQGFFNASEPNAPLLLTVQPSAFLFNQLNPGAIENRSIASLGNDELGNEVRGLLVPNGQSLVLLGGNIINSGNLNAFGGRVELGSVASIATVGFNTDGSLSVPENIVRADVLINTGSQIDVASNDEGNITINARNIDILGRSRLRAGIFSGLGTADSQAGNIILNGTGQIQVGQSSLIINNVGAGGSGNAGNINITAGSLLVGGAQLQAVTFGRGDAGDVIINADNRVLFDDGDAISRVEEDGIGIGGNINIDTGSLEVRNGAQLVALTEGQGDAGNVIINADDRVLFDGIGADGLSSAAFTGVGEDVEGNGGNININANSLIVRGGARLNASARGQGNAGSVIINARDQVVLDNSDASSTVEAGGIGNAGNIGITAGSLFVTGGAQLQTFSRGQGDAGNVIINADDRVLFDNGNVRTGAIVRFEGDVIRGNAGNIEIDTASLEVRNRASLGTSTLGQGDAGNVIINADDRVLFDNGTIFTTAVGSFEGETRGNAGNIEIDTASLEVRSGARLATSTSGQGDAGNVIIHADDRVLFNNGTIFTTAVGSFDEGETRGNAGNIEIDTASLEVRNRSSLVTSTFERGNAGNVIINANTFEATDGGQVSTTTGGSGEAGNITLNVTDRITLSSDGRSRASGLFADTESNSSGEGGSIEIVTGELDVSDRARVVVNSQGSGIAGDVNITAQSIQLDRGRVTAQTNTVDGGSITLQDLDLLLLRNGSLISTTAGTDRTAESVGDGGNINVDADFIVAFPNENSDIQANAFEGAGGNIDITTEGLFGIEERDPPTEFSDITASSEQGVQGTININTPDVDPSRGLTELPAEVVDASDQIAQTCPTDGDIAGEVGEFVVTGQGGLPADPAEILGGETVLSELAEVEGEESEGDETGERDENNGEMSREIDRPSAIANNDQTEIVEAQGWVVGADGKVMLTAENPTVEPHRSPIAPVFCPSS